MTERARDRWDLLLSVGIALAVAVAAALRLYFLQSPLFDGSDPATRALFGQQLRAWGWGGLYGDTVWAPGHFWWIAWGQLALGDDALGARLPSVLATALAPWPAALIASRAARSEGHDEAAAAVAGLVAALLLATLPLLARFGTLAYAEPVALAPALAALAALMPRRRAPPAWIASPALLTVAVSLRFESLLLAPLLFRQLPGRPARRAALAALPALPVLLWALPRPAFTLHNSFVRAGADTALRLSEPGFLGSLVDLLRWGGAATAPWLALAGLGLLSRRGLPARALAWVTGGWLALMAAGHTPIFERYLLLMVALLTVLAGLGVARVVARWPPVGVTLALTVAAIGLWQGRIAVGTRPPRPGPELRAAELLAAASVEHPGPVFVDPARRTAAFVYLHSDVPPGRRARLARSARGDAGLIDELRAALARGEPLLVVTVAGGELGPLLGEPPGCGAWSGPWGEARCLGRADDYRIHLLTGQR